MKLLSFPGPSVTFICVAAPPADSFPVASAPGTFSHIGLIAAVFVDAAAPTVDVFCVDVVASTAGIFSVIELVATVVLDAVVFVPVDVSFATGTSSTTGLDCSTVEVEK